MLRPFQLDHLSKAPKFTFGQMILTDWVDDSMHNNEAFHDFVIYSINKYLQADWWDTHPDDIPMNDESYMHTDKQRLLAAYNLPDVICRPCIQAEWINDRDWGHPRSIWIITEYDHSVTTVLFPSEY